MKKELLLISLSLFSVTLSAQHIHSIMNKKVRTELTRERIKSDRETQEAQKREEIKNNVNNGIAHYKLERLREATETVSINLLDELIRERFQKCTYTYSKDGKRNEEKIYDWVNEAWNFSYTRKYDYQYDNQQRCIKRSILLNETELTRTEISYEDGNRILKHYDLVRIDSLQTLSLTYEVGYDSQMCEILSKQYVMGELVFWKENKFNKEGEEILSLYWNNGYGNKRETTINGLQTIALTYSCDKETPEWTLTQKERTELNEAGRSTLEETSYYEGETIARGEKSMYTYDSYNRTIGWTFQIYENNALVNRAKEEYTYWGTEHFEPDSEDDSEGPLLTYNYSEWENEQWKKIDYATITRNEEGIALSVVMVVSDEITLNGQEIETKEEGTGTFNEKGLLVLTESKIYRADNNSLLYQKKTENKYDEKNRRTLHSDFKLIENDWKLMEEDARMYDQQDRKIVESTRYIDEEADRWSGSKNVFTYQDDITSTTNYPVEQNGEFRSTPQHSRSLGILANGRQQGINFTYDDSGTITDGSKMERQDTGIEIKLPSPENYNDGIDVVYEVGFDTNYSANYNWIDGNWFLINEQGCYQDGNDIILSHTVEGIIMSKSVFSFDTNKRLIGLKEYNNRDSLAIQTIYEYNSDGLLIKKDQGGNITTYKYSKHDVTGVEKNTVSVLNVYGRTITADNAEALLQVYSTSGTLVASGIKTVTLPEGGLYIVVTGSIRQKIVIR